METKLEIAKKWLNENSDDLEAFKGLVRCINEIKRGCTYWNLVFKMELDFTYAFGICVGDNFSFKGLGAITLLTNSPRAINAYGLFDEYLRAVRAILRYGTVPEIAISRLPTDVNSFNDSIQYLRENATVEEINLFLDWLYEN